MNIFEQYGIKEVADVTLYAIELNKYDDEVYVPIMYLDTLKVSTVESTAEQSTARGGLGNPELITWDYGREITLTLEDALFTPASQSMMWGGKFGIKNTKIYGIWNPYIYEKDERGKTIWAKKFVAYSKKESDYELQDNGTYKLIAEPDFLVIENAEDDNDKNYYKIENGKIVVSEQSVSVNLESLKTMGFISFICPCDLHEKYMFYAENQVGHYKYYKDTAKDLAAMQEDQLVGAALKCPKKYPIVVDKENPENSILKGYYVDEIVNTSWFNKERPEYAEITIKNFGDFQLEQYSYVPFEANDTTYCELINGTSSSVLEKCQCSHAYIWKEADLLLTSLEGEQDIYTINDTAVSIRVPIDSSDKQITIANKSLYETVYDEDTSSWKYVENGEKIKGQVNLSDRFNSAGTSYAYKYDEYGSKIDVFINMPWTIPSAIQDKETSNITRIKVGTFYIIDDWNSFVNTPYEMIYPIKEGMEDVKIIERMEKCKAPQTFAIDAKKNLASYNYAQLPQYENTNLTYFIDPHTMKPFEPNASEFRRSNGQVVNGDLRIIKQHDVYYKWTRRIAKDYQALGNTLIIDAEHYPGTYRLVGETYIRSRDTGKDQRYQFEVPLAKMSAENNLTLQADGDPTTFSMTLKALRREDGVMMKLTKYDVDCEKYDNHIGGGHSIIPIDNVDNHVWEDFKTEYNKKIELVAPDTKLYYVNAGNNVQVLNSSALLTTNAITTKTSFNFNTANLNIEHTNNSTSRVLDPNEYTIEIEDITGGGN